MNQTSSLLVSCGGTEQIDSFAIRSDNLARLTTYEGCRSLQSKHLSSISSPFILTVYIDRTKRLASSHITGFIPKSECSLIADISCISSGGNYFAAGSDDGTIRIWRINDGELVIEQQLYLGPLTVIYIDTNLWVLYAASKTGRVGAWAIPELYGSSDPENVWPIHSLEVTDMTISTNNRIFTVSLDKTAKCIDFYPGCEILSYDFEVSLTCCALSHNESIFYCGGIDGSIFQIQISQDNGNRQKFVGHTSQITDIVISEDDRSVYSSSLDMSIRRWDAATGQTINHISTDGAPFALNFLPQLDKATATSQASEEGKKNRPSRRERSNQNAKKPFPKLKRNIAGNVDELVAAPVDDLPILSPDEELSIAISDICSHNQVTTIKNQKDSNEKSEASSSETTTEKGNGDSELDELKRQNGLMFQYILSQKK